MRIHAGMRLSRMMVSLVSVAALLGASCYRDAKNNVDDDRTRGSRLTDRTGEYEKARQARLDEENADRAKRAGRQRAGERDTDVTGEDPHAREQREARERIEDRNHDHDSDLSGR